MNYTTYNECLAVAMRQSAYDLCCKPTDFTKTENVIVTSRKNENARRYLSLPFSCQLVSYGSNVVASVGENFRELTKNYIEKYKTEHIFETPNLHVLNEDFSELYTPTWSNALCADRKELDVLGVGAYHDGRLIGLAGCSADCETMWQIGIDVLPDYKREGIAAALTSRLADEILKRGRVPFYCAAWSNIASVRNALKSGFRPAWVEMTAKPAEFVEKMNLA